MLVKTKLDGSRSGFVSLNTSPCLYIGMRGLNTSDRRGSRTLFSCRSITRPFAKIVRFGGNSEKPSSSHNAGIRFGSVKDEKEEKVR